LVPLEVNGTTRKKATEVYMLLLLFCATITVCSAGLVEGATSCDLLIVGLEAYRPAVETFISFKLGQGVVARFVSVESISLNLQPEELHEFIANEYRQAGIKYVLFIGTFEQVPTKYVYSPSYEEFADFNYKPTDWYYGVPDWKDPEVGFLNGNIPKIAVGRLPVRNKEELHVTLTKIIHAEAHVSTGNFLFYSDIGNTFEAQLSMPYTYYTADANQTLQPLSTLLSKATYATTITHGTASALYAKTVDGEWKTLLSTQDAANINGSYSIHYLVACFTGALDLGKQSLAQTLITSPKGPALVIANSRTELSNTPIPQQFWNALFDSGNVGTSFLKALQAYLADSAFFSKDEPTFDKYNLYLTKTLYGDPSWTISSPQRNTTPNTQTETALFNNTQTQAPTTNHANYVTPIILSATFSLCTLSVGCILKGRTHVTFKKANALKQSSQTRASATHRAS
jgi:hypothetical protein